jgi:hypothetical protein
VETGGKSTPIVTVDGAEADGNRDEDATSTNNKIGARNFLQEKIPFAFFDMTLREARPVIKDSSSGLGKVIRLV